MTTRQQRRQQVRALEKAGTHAVTSGLPRDPELNELIAPAWLLASTLADADVAYPAGAAAQKAHDLFNASLRKIPTGLEICCHKGCSYCCYAWVGATAPEIFLLADAVRSAAKRSGGATVASIIDRCTMPAGLDVQERFGAKVPCALLVNDACSQHTNRPTMCRQVTSTDLAACIDEFEGRDRGGDVPVSATFIDHARNSRIVLQAAIQASGRSARTYELNAALARALSAENSEHRWLAGEDVFAGIAQAPPEAEPLRGAMRSLAAAVRELMPPKAGE